MTDNNEDIADALVYFLGSDGFLTQYPPKQGEKKMSSFEEKKAICEDRAFINQFRREVRDHYDVIGSKLRNTVRTIDGVKGGVAVFQKVGKGTASTKSTHGMVPVMNLCHSNVGVALQDYYAGDWIENLVGLKTNLSERDNVCAAGANALGRKSDELIIDALADAENHIIPDRNAGMTKDKILEAFDQFGEYDVPDDGRRFCIVGWKQWSELLAIPEFRAAEEVGMSFQAKSWLGTIFIPHSGLPIDMEDVRSCFWYHETAVGHASGDEIDTDVSWHGDRACHFVNNMLSQGAGVIDDCGVIEIQCAETVEEEKK